MVSANTATKSAPPSTAAGPPDRTRFEDDIRSFLLSPLLDHVPSLSRGLAPLVQAVPVVVVEDDSFGPEVRAFSVGLEPPAEREGVLGRGRRGGRRHHRRHEGSYSENQPDTPHPATSFRYRNLVWIATAR